MNGKQSERACWMGAPEIYLAVAAMRSEASDGREEANADAQSSNETRDVVANAAVLSLSPSPAPRLPLPAAADRRQGIEVYVSAR